MEKFNKVKYDNDYRKKHKKAFNTDLNIDEYKYLEELLKKHNMTKVDLIRYAIKQLEKKDQE